MKNEHSLQEKAKTSIEFDNLSPKNNDIRRLQRKNSFFSIVEHQFEVLQSVL